MRACIYCPTMGTKFLQGLMYHLESGTPSKFVKGTIFKQYIDLGKKYLEQDK